MKKEKVKNKKILEFIVIVGILLISAGTCYSAYAYLEPVRSVTISSWQLSYEKKDPGSFQIEKSAEWISKGKARITFNLDTVAKSSYAYSDVIFVLDVSGSMDGEKLKRVKEDSIELGNELLADENNRAAIITFSTQSEILLDFTNDQEEFSSKINALGPVDRTNYYQALVNVEKLLEDYEFQSDRDCVVLFLTDGYPNEDIPNEVTQYMFLKDKYPFLSIHGIQYEMGEDILDPIKNISDRYFIADVSSLNHVLFEAKVTAILYDSFVITDYINNEFFEIESISSIQSSFGTVSLDYEGGVPKVTWNLENFRSGSQATLTIDVLLKEESQSEMGLYPTNIKEEVSFKIEDVEEQVVSEERPILSNHYLVTYEGNAPEGCTVKGVPEASHQFVQDNVEIKGSVTCDGYHFKGWEIATDDVIRINEDYFKMPEKDVIIRAEWSKLTVEKKNEGKIWVYAPPVIQKVSNEKIWAKAESITKIIFQNQVGDVLNSIESWDISEAQNSGVVAHIVPNVDDATTYTAYIQGTEKIIANEDSSNLFSGFTKLQTIEGLEYLDTSNAVSLDRLFHDCRELTSIDLSHFDTSKVTSMVRLFKNCQSLTSIDITPLDMSNISSLNGLFEGCKSLTSINLSHLDTSKITDMSHLFSDCESLTNIDLRNFNTSQVTTMAHMFYGCIGITSASNLNISSFDTSNVTDMSYMFYELGRIPTLVVTHFNTSKVTNMEGMFGECRALTSLDLSNFDTSNVRIMENMFHEDQGLTSLDLGHFNTSQVTNMRGMFFNCLKLKDLNIINFDTSNVTDMRYMFYQCYVLVTEFTLRSNNPANVQYEGMFSYTSTNNAWGIYTVIYTLPATKQLGSNMEETKSKNSQVARLDA